MALTKSDFKINGQQLADLVSYPIARYVIDSEMANLAFGILAHRIYEVEGVSTGLILYP